MRQADMFVSASLLRLAGCVLLVPLCLLAAPVGAEPAASPADLRQAGPEGLQDGALASAMVAVHEPGGKLVGAGQLRQVGHDIELTFDLTILPPGSYVLTLNEVGQCLGPDYASAGAPLIIGDGRNDAPPRPAATAIEVIAMTTYGRAASYMRGASLASWLQGNGTALVVSQAPVAGSTAAGRRMACGVWQPD